MAGLLDDLRRDNRSLQQQLADVTAQLPAATAGASDGAHHEAAREAVMHAEVTVLRHDQQRLQQRLDGMAQRFVASMTQLKQACMALTGWRCVASARLHARMSMARPETYHTAQVHPIPKRTSTFNES